VRRCVLAFAVAGFSFAQSVTTKYSTDINGYRIPESTSTANGSSHTELYQSINGKNVPLERSEQRVLRDDPSGKVTETILRKYDRDGHVISTERTVSEEQKLTGGASHIQATTFRTDVNGREEAVERRSTDTKVSSGTTITDISVQRPSPNGGFEIAEKRNLVSQAQSTRESIYRKGIGGDFVEAVRETKTTVKNGDQTLENTAEYEIGATGQLQLHSQSSATIVKQADGSEARQVNLYGPSMWAQARTEGAPPTLQEQQIINRKKNTDGSVVETLSVRRPTVSDPNRLGDITKISETVCTGKCDTPAK
jgi:hypothetical protein